MADISSLIKNEFIPAINSHNIDKVLQCFDDNAVLRFDPLRPDFPETLQGKSEIRTFFETVVPGTHVETSNFKATGNRLEWTMRVDSERLHSLGVNEEVNIQDKATIENNKIVSLTHSLPKEIAQKLPQRGGGQPSR